MHFSSTPAQLTALASGDLDIAQLGYSMLGAAVENAHMADVRIIADELEDGRPGWATTHFTVLKDSPIKTIDDLGLLKGDIDVAKYADLSIVGEASKRLGVVMEE